MKKTKKTKVKKSKTLSEEIDIILEEIQIEEPGTISNMSDTAWLTGKEYAKELLLELFERKLK